MARDAPSRAAAALTRLLFVRHGESVGNALGVVQGHVDYELSALGHLQAEATALALKPLAPDAIFTSPLLRAAQTATIIAGSAGLEPEPLPDVREYGMGEASGLTIAEVRDRFPEVVAARRRGERLAYPGEEGRDLFHARLASALSHLTSQTGTLVVVAHGGIINAVCARVLGIPPARRGVFQVANCSISEVMVDPKGPLVLHRHNDVCHLRGIATVADNG